MKLADLLKANTNRCLCVKVFQRLTYEHYQEVTKCRNTIDELLFGNEDLNLDVERYNEVKEREVKSWYLDYDELYPTLKVCI